MLYRERTLGRDTEVRVTPEPPCTGNHREANEATAVPWASAERGA